MSFPQVMLVDKFAKSVQRFIMIFCSAVIVLIVGIAALLRYLFGADLYGAEEFLTIAAFWMYFASAVYATHTRSHISAEVFSTFCKNNFIRRLVHFFQLGITIALGMLYSYWGWQFFYWSLTEGGKSTVWQIPLVVSHTAVFLGFLLITWYFVLQLIGDVKDLLRVKIRIASQYSASHSATLNLDKLKDRIEEASAKKIRIQVCPDNELGDYTKVHQGLSQGIIGMALISVPSQLDKRLGAIYLPHLATSYDEAKKLYARGSSLFKEANQVHKEIGIKFLGFNMEGFGGIALTNIPKELKDPSKGKDLSIRVPPMPVFKESAGDQGFAPVTVPFSEVENILEADGVEGIIGCPPMPIFLRYKKHIKHFLVNYGFLETTSYLMSEALWNSFNESQQQLFQETIDRLSQQSFEEAERVDKEYLDQLAKAGINVIRLSSEELQQWARHSRLTTWPKLYSDLSPELVDMLRAQAGRIQS